MRLLKDFIVQVRTDLLTQVIQPGRFSSPEPNLTFHIRERALNGELLGLVMHDTRDPKQAQSYLAERGVIVKQDPTAYLVMTNGHILRRSDADDPAQIIAFDKYAVDLDKFEPEGSDDNELKPRERYFSELAYPDPKSGLYQNQPGLFRSELHERLSSPFYPFAFVFIVIAFCGQARSTRTSRMQNLVLAFVTAAGCRLAGLGLNNLVAAKASMVPTLYLLPLCAVLVSLIAIKSGGRQSSGPSRLGEIKDVIAMALAKITARSPLKRAGQRS